MDALVILPRLWSDIWKDVDNGPDKVNTKNKTLPLNKLPPKNVDHVFFITSGRIQLADLRQSRPQTAQGRRRARSVYPQLMECCMVLFIVTSKTNPPWHPPVGAPTFDLQCSGWPTSVWRNPREGGRLLGGAVRHNLQLERWGSALKLAFQRGGYFHFQYTARKRRKHILCHMWPFKI